MVGCSFGDGGSVHDTASSAFALYWADGRSTLAVALERLGQLLAVLFLFCLETACAMLGMHL